MSRLAKLTVSDEGFVFDPGTGESFACNETALDVLRGLKDGRSQQEITQELTRRFAVEPQEASVDVLDFVTHLRILKILQ